MWYTINDKSNKPVRPTDKAKPYLNSGLDFRGPTTQWTSDIILYDQYIYMNKPLRPIYIYLIEEKGTFFTLKLIIQPQN